MHSWPPLLHVTSEQIAALFVLFTIYHLNEVSFHSLAHHASLPPELSH